MTARSGWALIRDDLISWNARLLLTDAHLYQYPYWTEPLRAINLSPRYLAYHELGQVVGYVCLLEFGRGPLRIALVRGGPVSLLPDAPLSDAALDELVEWSKRRGYVFIRFSHPNASLVDRLARRKSAHRVDAFPFYPHLGYGLVVEQKAGDDEMLRGFQRIARRDIHAAKKIGYRISADEPVEGLAASVSVYDALVDRKGKVYDRPFSTYLELARLAAPHHSARAYTAWLNGKPVQTLLIVRDRDTAHYVFGALDAAALEGRASPGCLLHWTAMRDFYAEGARFYDLGPWGSDSVPIFKMKFRPRERRFPPPLSVALKPLRYGLWSALLPTLVRARGPLGRLAVPVVAHRRTT